MKNTIIAAVAGFAATAAAAQGSAIVNNNCDYPVYISYVEGGVTPDAPKTVSANTGSWSESYVNTQNGGGWSIKISKEESQSGDILQYEYTLAGEQVYFDMSLVNVQTNDTSLKLTPFQLSRDLSWNPQPVYAKLAPIPWEFSVSESATFSVDNTLWYNYWNETASQCGTSDTDIVLNLCPSGSSSGSSATSSAAFTSASSTQLSSYSASAYASSSSSASAVQTTFATSTSASPSSSSSAASSSSTGGYGHSWGGVIKEADVQAQTTAITTSSASVTTSTAANGNVATEVVVDYVTEIATAYVTERDAQPTPAVHRRHTHGHPHGPHHA